MHLTEFLDIEFEVSFIAASWTRRQSQSHADYKWGWELMYANHTPVLTAVFYDELSCFCNTFRFPFSEKQTDQ